MHLSPKADYCWKCGTHKKEKKQNKAKKRGEQKTMTYPKAQKYTPNQRTFELGHLTFGNIQKQSKRKMR